MAADEQDPGFERGVGVNRLLAFADAVFSIAITLLALDIDLPAGLTDAQVPDALWDDALPQVGAYLLSFVVIGAMWLGHHGIFRLIRRLDGLLMRIELAFLAVIAALPFPTRMMSEYGHTAEVTTIYACSIALAGLLMTAMTLRILARPRLRHTDVTTRNIHSAMLESVSLAAVFALSTPITLVSVSAAQYSWLVLLPIRRFLPRWGYRSTRRPADDLES